VLFERLEVDVAPMRESYDALIARPAVIEDILQEGAKKARAIAAPKIAELRDAIGLRSGVSVAPKAHGTKAAASKGGKSARFASFRDADGSFRFRLFSADGEELLLSRSFADPKTAGAMQKRIKELGSVSAVVQVQPQALVLELDGEPVGATPDYDGEQARDEALDRLRGALDQLAAQE
jgi:tryptophanyl-tRNA synthetase